MSGTWERGRPARRHSAELFWLSFLLLASCATVGGAADPGSTPTASDFTLKSLSGETISLSDYLGKKVILLNFCASWCQPCAAELHHLEGIYQRHRDQGFVLLGIAMDGPETAAELPGFARRHGISYPLLYDEETRAVSLYNPKRSAPLNVLIDRQGKVRKVREGFNPGDEQAIESEIVGLLESR